MTPELVQRLAVLTAAGMPAASAWRHVGTVVANGLESAHDLPDRLAAAARAAPPEERPRWQVLAAIWAVATESGAALAPALERAADVLRDLDRSSREVEVALAGPRATSRVVLALPLLAVVLGALLGFDLVGAFLSPVGAVCALVGVVLVIAAARWNRRLLRWARERDPTPGLACDLYAIALAGGASLDRAGAIVGAACASAGLPLDDSVDAVLGFARTAGVPVIALLGAEADGARRESRAAAAERAVRLETRLLLPLGLCVLPAFVLLGVVPIALAILSSTALAA